MQGLKELYDFKENYPEKDIEPYIANRTQLFRNYVERGLKAIEQERKSATSSGMNVSNISAECNGRLCAIFQMLMIMITITVIIVIIIINIDDYDDN